MIDIIDVADRADVDVVIHQAAVRHFHRNDPFARFRAEQHDLSRFLVVHHQRVRVGRHFDGRSSAGADVVDYVSLTLTQGDRHRRAFVGEQQGWKQKHADNAD